MSFTSRCAQWILKKNNPFIFSQEEGKGKQFEIHQSILSFLKKKKKKKKNFPQEKQFYQKKWKIIILTSWGFIRVQPSWNKESIQLHKYLAFHMREEKYPTPALSQ